MATTKKKAPSAKKKSPAKKKAAKPKKLKTRIAIVLDRSSSMESVRAETIALFNEQVESILKDSVGMDTTISLVLFSDLVETLYFNEPVDKLVPLTVKTYKPHGYTAMYDGVGKTIDKMLAEIKDINDDDTAALIIVISDGAENASRTYGRNQVAEKIKTCQATKRWTFSYLGANQDLSVISKDLNIPVGNMQVFTANAAGVRGITGQSVNASRTYMSSRRSGDTHTTSYYSSGGDSGSDKDKK